MSPRPLGAKEEVGAVFPMRQTNGMFTKFRLIYKL